MAIGRRPEAACDDGEVEPIAQAIIEEIIDPLMMGGLAESHPNIALRRTAPNVIEIDYGSPGGVYVITVEPRATETET